MERPVDPLILVDSEDRERGWLGKEACHDGEGQLHRAFSVFLFNEAGALLIHQRSQAKRLWPGFWSNSCCSHPRWNEDVMLAAARRVREELGVESGELEFAYKFEYHAQFGTRGAEHELCHVFLGRMKGKLAVDSREIESWKWLHADQLDVLMSENPDGMTPWFKLEWAHLTAHFGHLLEKYQQSEVAVPHSR